MEPKYSYGQLVYIKKGFYRGYKGEIRSFQEVNVKNQKTEEEETTIQYTIKIENIKETQTLLEINLIPYKKWVIF